LFVKKEGDYAGFLMVDSSYAFFFIQSMVLTMLIDWDAALCMGDDVAVPALGQSIFLDSSCSILFSMLMFSHHLSRVLTLAASIYPVKVSKKIRFGLYFGSNFGFFILTTNLLL
jgi:hypothetical protein